MKDAEVRARQAPVWRVPLLLAAVSASGLFSALVTDGWGDVWSWCALGGLLLLATGCVWRGARRTAK